MTRPCWLIAVLTSLIVILPGQAEDPGPPLQRIAFGSCAHQDRPQPIWDAVVGTRPNLFLFLGDTVYADTDDMVKMRATYAKLAAVPGWKKLRQTCPIMATWDDHEYGKNDAGFEYPKKRESQQIFLDFFEVAKDSPRRTQEGVYEAKIFGPPGKRVQVILLDTRYHRSALTKKARSLPWEGSYLPNPNPKSTFLGEAQWKWLEAQLRQPAEVRLLGSSIQVVAEDHGFEKWMNLPSERERLYKVLADSRVGGVVILSGDRHLAELSVMDAGLGYPLYDLTSSGMNQASKRWRRPELHRHRLMTMNWGDNFGLITLDWDRPDPRIGLQIRDEDGEITIQQKLPLSFLQPGTLSTGPSALPRLESGLPLTPAVIKEHLEKKVTVFLTVRSTGSGSGRIFLNSHDDFRNPDNFTLVLEKTAQNALKESGVAGPQEAFRGKNVRVSGSISLFRDRPQILITDPKQITIEKTQP